MTMLKVFWTKLSFLSRLRLFFGAFLCLMILVFLYLKVVPFGHITYTKTWPAGLRSGKGFIYDFKPAERLATGTAALRVIADPVYFSLFTPRRFDQVQVTVKYRERLGTTTPIIELGVLQDKIAGSYELRPLQNDIVDALRFSWPRLDDSAERLVLQQEREYSSLADFDADLAAGHLRGCPSGPAACVAVYDYSLPEEYRVPDYVRLSPLTIDQPLRGSHQFYVYFPSGPWRLKFSFTDLNQDRAADPVTVNVYRDGQLAATQAFADANPDPTGGQTETKDLTLTGQAASGGVYKVEVRISDDVVIARLESSSEKLAFINKIWPVSGAGVLTLFTDAAYLQATAFDPANLGSISFGGQAFALDTPYRQFTWQAGPGVKEIKLAKDDIVLSNSGVFAFSRAGLFNPAPARIDRFFAPGGDTRYVMAAYERPLLEAGRKTARASFNISGADRDKGKYTFLISVPGLDGTAPENYLDIEEIQVELSGRTLWQKIWD